MTHLHSPPAFVFAALIISSKSCTWTRGVVISSRFLTCLGRPNLLPCVIAGNDRDSKAGRIVPLDLHNAIRSGQWAMCDHVEPLDEA